MGRNSYDEAIAVTREIYWVGFHEEESHLHCNPYLLIDDNDVVLFDPGSIPDFPNIMRKIIDVVNPADISVIVLGHQDPDVCGNLAVVEDVIGRDDIRVAAHINTIRLVKHLGASSSFYPVDEHDHQLTLVSGRVLEFLATPYLHSPGAIVTYDRKTKSLFSSDLFGALSNDWSLFAGGDFIKAMELFHQAYMPSNRILRSALERLEERWEIDRILPQHGSVIEGENVKRAFDHLKGLPCGIDLE